MFYKKHFFSYAVRAVFLIFSAAAFAEYNFYGIPDSSEIRKSLSREWFEGPLDYIRTMGAENRKNSVGIDFQIRFEEQDEEFILIIAPKSQGRVSIHDAEGSRTITEGLYNADESGSWLLVRDKKTGNPILARYYFAADSGVYVQFRPNKAGGKNSSFADMIIFSSYAARSVPLGVPFAKFYHASFAEIQELTKKTLPWKSVVPKSFFAKANSFETFEGNYDEVLLMIQEIRGKLKDIVYADDAIYDEYGNPVSLQNGKERYVSQANRKKITLCSHGFVKWIVDGIIMPLAGSYTKREPLVQKTVDPSETGFQGIKSTVYNTYSALDWTRNLAAAALSVASRRNIKYEKSGVDVTTEPFSAMITDRGILNTAGYVKNSGYKILYMKQLLYVLAATYPDYFYLAAIRQNDTEAKVETFVFNECAAIFPYFDKSGAFRTVVFYDGNEYNLEQFCNACSANKRKDIFIHLTRVKSSASFYPQEPESEQ